MCKLIADPRDLSDIMRIEETSDVTLFVGSSSKVRRKKCRLTAWLMDIPRQFGQHFGSRHANRGSVTFLILQFISEIPSQMGGKKKAQAEWIAESFGKRRYSRGRSICRRWKCRARELRGIKREARRGVQLVKVKE